MILLEFLSNLNKSPSYVWWADFIALEFSMICSVMNPCGLTSEFSAFCFYTLNLSISFNIFRLYHMNNNRIIENITKFLIIFSSLTMAVLVSLSRIYLEYHTLRQVLWGAIVGILFATFWFALTYLVLTPLFPQIVSW